MTTAAVIGSRTFTNNILLRSVLDAEHIQAIVSGGARGADALGAAYAREKGISLKEFLPEYDKYGRAAPIIRNRTIVENSDRIIAFWDGKSVGTQNAINYARKLKKPVTVYDISKAQSLNRSSMIGEPHDRQSAWSRYMASERSLPGAARILRAEKKLASAISDREKRFQVAYCYSQKHFNAAKYKGLAGKDNVYFVMPSSSGNLFPLALATLLKETFGGEIVAEYAVQKHASGIKNLIGLDKVFAERNYAIDKDKIKCYAEQSGKNVVVVDDLVSTGGTIDALCRNLNETGIKVNSVCSLVMTASSLMSDRSIDEVYNALAKNTDDPIPKEKIETVFHNSLGIVSFHLHRSINESTENISKIRQIINEKYLTMVNTLKIDTSVQIESKQECLFEGTGLEELRTDYVASDEIDKAAVRAAEDADKLEAYALTHNLRVPSETKGKWIKALMDNIDVDKIKGYIDKTSDNFIKQGKEQSRGEAVKEKASVGMEI